MKYIDAEKLKECLDAKYKEFTEKAKKDCPLQYQYMADGLDVAEQFIDSLQQEQPDNGDIDKVAQELYEHLYELKRRNNVPTNLYDKQEIIDLWKAGIVYGRSHPKQEQPEVDLEKEIDRVFFQKDCGSDRLYYKEIAKIAHHFYELGLKARKESIKDCNGLDEAAMNYIAPIENEDGLKVINFSGRDIKDAFIAGAEWGEKNAYKAIMKKADEVRDKRFDTDYEVKIEPAAGFDLSCVNIYREGKLVGHYVEPKEEKKPAEGVEEAAKEYDEVESWRYEALKYPRREAFEAGAEWQRNQLKTNSISAGYNQTDEEYDREMDFATSIIEKEYRQPTFSDAINYGIKLQKEQIMKEGLKGEVCGRVRDHINIRFPDGLCKYLIPKNISHIPADVKKYEVGDKVRVIIVKDEEE